MPEFVWPVFLAALVGLAITTQGALNTLLSKYIGSLEMALAIHVVGVTLIGVLFLSGLARGHLSQWVHAPWYAYLGGALGVFIVISVPFVLTRVGASGGFATVIAAQLVAATLIDQWGLFGIPSNPITLVRATGLVLLLAGAWLVLQK